MMNGTLRPSEAIMDLHIPELEASHVKMKDTNQVMLKIKKMIQGGPNKLQIITDFDRTLSKFRHNGVISLSSNNIYKLIPSVTTEFLNKTNLLYDEYRPIEDDPSMSVEEKIPYMETWWRLSFECFIGLPYDQDEIIQAVKDSQIVMRTGTDSAFQKLNQNKIPVLVFSSGLGNVVLTVLKEYNLYLDNVRVISNFFRIENGIIVGLQDEIMHVFNKNEHAIENRNYFKDLKDKENAIVLGDSLGDADMANGLQGNGEILKIGFLSTYVNQFMPQYLEKFDIVLVEDETMDVFNAILSKILQI